MGEVLKQSDRLKFVSVSRLAELLCMDRKTVTKRLVDNNIGPSAMRDGYPIYDGRKACEACLLTQTQGEDGPLDPRLLRPLERRAWYQSERERMAVESEARQLIPALEVHGEMAELTRTFVQWCDTLGDQLERDCGLTPEQVDAVNRSITRQRAQLYERCAADLDSDQAASA